MPATSPYWIGFGDIHDDTRMFAAIPELPGAAAALVSGDLTMRGGPQAAAPVLSALTAINPHVLAVIGNMDQASVEGLLAQEGMLIQASSRELAPGLGVMGVGWSTPTPFDTPSEAPDATIAAWLEAAYESAKGFDRLILVCHNPPVNTAVDLAGGVNHVGSPAVRAFIERVQPDVCLTGHIHEARSLDRIGETLIVNPGNLAAGGYAVISLQDGRVTARLGQA
ncbi:MAG: metallophosphoesterase family protein [Desulfovibrionaceae bacterium]|nr:metallophosphoesterase family protein [Desulfovibrionaceae bacterium]MBF0515414.1 metallophosphoesterase family protein [Desulfovibrionaceae bacterium]